jgi:hypothetical protein
LGSSFAAQNPIRSKQRRVVAERTGGIVQAAASIDAAKESQVDVVDLVDGARALTTKLAPQKRGCRLPDLTAFVAVARLCAEAEGQLAEDEASLRHAYGASWPQVPRGHGALAAQAKEILGGGIVPLRLGVADPVNVLRELDSFVKFTSDTSKHLLEQASLLGEALGADLSGLTLGDLRRLSRAVLRLADVPPPNPAWCRPAAAHAASVALSALGEDVKAATVVHQQLYEDFTEDVWNLPSVRQHKSVDRWWQLAGRRGLRSELASVSRTGRAPSNLKSSIATLRRAVELRENIDAAWSSLRGHLGWFADAPIPDAEGATKSLDAIQQLHAALKDRANYERLTELARADAFLTEEVTGPADAVGDAVYAWAGLAKRFNGPDPLAFAAPELAQWAIVTAQSLQVLRSLKETTAPLRQRIRSVGELFDDAVARDRVDQLRALLGLAPAQEGEQS